MSRILQLIGLLTLIVGLVIGINELYTNFTDVSNTVIHWTGILSLIGFTIYGILRLIYGKKWKRKAAAHFLVGSDLITAINEFLGELPNPKKETIAVLTGHIIYRFTRLGLIGLMLALVPIILLWQQNGLITKQNEKIDQQNVRLNQQTALLEADRRGAVIFESGNVLDAMARELEQKKEGEPRTLSDPLIGRIIALSRSFKPYRYLDPDADTLIEKAISPERGHLLVSLINSNLDSTTHSQILKGADFSKADLQNAILWKSNLLGATLIGANLQEAKLWESNLREINLLEADLRGADLQQADLSESLLERTDFSETSLRGANLRGAMLEYAKVRGAKLEGAKLEGSFVYYSQADTFLKYGADTTGIRWLLNPEELRRFLDPED